jgi:hypothetical protein
MGHSLRTTIVAAFALLPALLLAQDFTVSVIVTAEGDTLFRAWDSGKLGFKVVPVGNAARKQFLSAVVLFTGCQADAAGNCNAEMTITAYDPQGKEYGAMPGAELWKRKPAPQRGATQLSRDYMGIVIEPSDPAGTYRVHVVARDLNAKREAKSETTFSVK